MTTMYEKEEKTFPVWLYVTQDRYNKEEKWKCEAFHIIQKIVTIEKQKK